MLITEKSRCEATMTSPRRGRTAGSSSPNHPRARASSRASNSARPPSTDRQVPTPQPRPPGAPPVAHPPATAVEVPEPRLAAEQRQSLAENRVLVHVEAVLRG